MEEKIDEILLANFKEGDWQTARKQLLGLFAVSNRRELLLTYEKWRLGHKLNATEQWHKDNVDLFLSQ